MSRLFALACSALVFEATAQSYCTPFFANGCFDWRTFEVQAGSMAWTPGADDCWIAIYTGMSTEVAAGTVLPMRVTNGVWCGCAVWVDLDQSESFEASENLFYSYVGGAPSHQYEFGIAIPAGTPTGAYRLRVISPWGSDGFLTDNGNGNGPCGSYQYGDFKDFTLNVNGTMGFEEARVPDLLIAPNPAAGAFILTGAPQGAAVEVLDIGGRAVHRARVLDERVMLDAGSWPAGMYAVRVTSESGSSIQRLVVE